MRKYNDGQCQGIRTRERQLIEEQVRAFLDSGGEIEVLGSAFDQPNDPKCKLSDDLNLLL